MNMNSLLHWREAVVGVLGAQNTHKETLLHLGQVVNLQQILQDHMTFIKDGVHRRLIRIIGSSNAPREHDLKNNFRFLQNTSESNAASVDT